MKKVLSMVLALALVLTTLVVPMTVSAAVGDDTVTLSFVVTNADGGNTIKRGENVKVDVYATPTNADTLQVTYYEFFVTYNSTSLEYVGAESIIGENEFINKGASVYVLNDGTTVSLAKDGGTKLATLTFSVKAGATSGSQISASNDAYFAFTSNTSYEDTEYTVAVNDVTVPLVDNTSSVTVAGTELGADARTFYSAAGVDVAITADNFTSVVIDVPEEGEDVTYNAGDPLTTYNATVAGAYTITVNLPETTVTYKFNLVLQDITATLAFEALADTVYYAGESFTIPVTLEGLAGAEAAMITFNVDYDADKFDLEATVNEEVVTTGQQVSVTDGAVSFGTENGNVGITGGNFVNLKFTVKQSVALGDEIIKISDAEGKEAQVALVTTGVDPTETEVGVTAATQTVNIVLADNAGYIASETGNGTYSASVWAAESYVYAITANADPAVEIRYIKSAEALEECTQSQFEGATALANGGITVDEATDYYIVVKCGTGYYQVIKALKNGETVFFDAGSPAISNQATANMDEWVGKGGTATIDLSQVVYTSSICDINKYEYSLGEDVWVDYTSTPAEIVIADCQENYTSMTIKITAENGKTATATITLMIDATAPSIALTDGGQANHIKTINIAVTNNEAGASPIAAIDVYYNATALGEETLDAIKEIEDKTSLGAEATSYAEADASGFYYFIVADAAGNEGWGVFNVTLEVLAAASDIKVESVDGKGSYETFKTQTEMTTIGITDKFGAVITSNGTFTKLTITTDEADAGYTNTFKLTKDDVEVVDEGVFTGTRAFAYDSTDAGNGAGKYILAVTTTNDNDAGDTLTDVYEFDIVAPANMISPDGNNTYNLRDYVKVQLLLTNQNKLTLPTAGIGFYGGLYAGDMDGDFTLTSEDASQLITSRRALEEQGAYYTLDIMNQKAPVAE